MSRILLEPFSRLISLLDGNQERKIIALAGYPGSGKSTLVREWMDGFPSLGQKAICLGMDGFHMSKAELACMPNPEEAFARRGAPFTFNPKAMVEKLREMRLAFGKYEVGWPDFQHETGDPEQDALKVEPECLLVVVEGIYTLFREGAWADLEGLFDEKWFLDTPIDVAITRLYSRHQKAFGLSEEEAVRRAEENDRLNCNYVLASRQNADFLIS